MNSPLVSRRSFLRQSAFTMACAWSAPTFLRSAQPNSVLQVAAIGVKGQGLDDLSHIGAHPKVRFVGFCDVDRRHFKNADEKFPGVPHFADYRQMLDQLGNRCDAVSVSTPDHMHAPIAMRALRQGKHVYCQKPLTHTVWEARQLRLQAERSGAVTQMGNQIHSALEYRLGVRLLREGAIGKIREVHSWIGVQGRQYTKGNDRPPAAALPPELDWNLWIGGAPMRPYAADVYHPFKWRDWQDFGSGALGDFGCHVLDPIFTALELNAPLRLRADHDGIGTQLWPGPETVTYIFPGTARTVGPELKVVWHDGGLKPDPQLGQLPPDAKLPGGGSMIVGEGGTMILPHWATPELFPESKFASFKYPKEQGFNHYHVWVDAVLAGRRTSDGFHYAGPLSETVQLGNVAARFPGVELHWDAAALKITNHAGAQRCLRRPHRSGFDVKPV